MKYGRDSLADVSGYVPGEQPSGVDIVKLNTNENPYPPSPKVLEAIQTLGADAVRRYPDPVSTKLRRACADRYGFEGESWVLAGNGMDELLALALRTFTDPGDAIVAPYPTYSLYEVLCALHGVTLAYAQLDDDFQLPESFFGARGRLCFLARPNAPTGVAYDRDVVARVCASFDGIVVIDEAYVDFGDDNCLDFPARFENAIVMRTFSKSFSLAGVRLGVAFARPELIAEFMKTKDSYNLDAFAQIAGRAAIEDYAWMEQNAAKVKATRARLRAALIERGFRVPDSAANFLLAFHDDAPTATPLFQRLREQNILVRYFDAPRLQNALRITVGTDQETDALITALEEMGKNGDSSLFRKSIS